MKFVLCLVFLVAVTRVSRVDSEHSLDVFKMYQLIQTMEDLFKDTNNLTTGFSCEGKSFQDCYRSILDIYKNSIEGEILKVINNTIVSYLTDYKKLALQYVHFLTPPAAENEKDQVTEVVNEINLKDTQVECVIGLLSVFKLPINNILRDYVFYYEQIIQANTWDELKEIVKKSFEGEEVPPDLNVQEDYNHSKFETLKNTMTNFSGKVCSTIPANWIKADLWIWKKVQKSYILSRDINDARNLLDWEDQILGADDESEKPDHYDYEYLVEKPVLKVCRRPKAKADQTTVPIDTINLDPASNMEQDEEDIDGSHPGTSSGQQNQQPTMSMECLLFNLQHQFVDLVLSLCGNRPYEHFRASSEYKILPRQPDQGHEQVQNQNETHEESYMSELSQILIQVETTIHDETPVILPGNGNADAMQTAKQMSSLRNLFANQYTYHNRIDDFHHKVAVTIDRYVSKVIFSKVLRLIVTALINYKEIVDKHPGAGDANLEDIFVEYFYLGQQFMIFKTVLELYISRGPVTLRDETIDDMNDILDFAIIKYLYHVLRMNDPTPTTQQIAEHLNDKRFYAVFPAELGASTPWQVQFDEIKQIIMYVNELVEIKGQN